MKNYYNTVLIHPSLISRNKSLAAVSRGAKAFVNLRSIISAFIFAAVCSPAIGQTGGAGPSGMSKLSIHLLLNTNGGSANTADGCMVLYKGNFNPGIGPEDSYKFTNLDENIALPVGNSLLSVEGKPFIVDYDTIPLRLWQYRQSNYYLQFTGSNFSPATVAVLKDNYLQQESAISLTSVTTINFTITADSASAAPDRFWVVMKPASTLPLALVSFKASQKENSILIEWEMAGETNVDHYEIERSSDAVNFVRVATAITSPVKRHQWYDRAMLNGSQYYRIKTVNKSGEMQLSNILKVAADAATPGISVYPNPVKGNIIGLQMHNLEKGTYYVKLYNANGQQLFSSVMQQAAGTATQQINIGNKPGKGTYTLNITNGTKFFSKAVIIE